MAIDSDGTQRERGLRKKGERQATVKGRMERDEKVHTKEGEGKTNMKEKIIGRTE